MKVRFPLTRFPDATTLSTAIQTAQKACWSDAIEGTASVWYLRQFDAAWLSHLANSLLDGDQLLELQVHEQHVCQGYLSLALAESQWLTGNSAGAMGHLATARACFANTDDSLGNSDADWIEAHFSHDVGRATDRDALIRRSLQIATNVGDQEREASCLIALACFDLFVHGERAKEFWRDQITPLVKSGLPAIQAFANQFMYLLRLNEGAHHLAIEHALISQRASEHSGLLRREIFAACNIGLSLTDLGDLDSALGCLDAALAKARAYGWPHPLGYCLVSLSSALLKTGRKESALNIAIEAGAVLAPFSQSTEYVAALTAIGQAALACGDECLARNSFIAVAAQDCPSEYPKARHYGFLGLARLAEQTGDLSKARLLCREALDLPAELPDYALDVDALQVLARVVEQLSATEAHRSDSLKILDEAISLAEKHLDCSGMHILLFDKAAILEKRGLHQEALRTLKAAIASLVAEKDKSAVRLSLSLEARFKTEHALAEAALHKELAAAESARSAELETLNAQLRNAVSSLNEAQELLLLRNQELMRAHAQISDLSLTDPLTGMRNRRFLSQVIESAVAESLRSYSDDLSAESKENTGARRKDIVFFLLDLDHFKQVNDEFGHAAGDAVLVQLRDRLSLVTRDQDFLVRWGGEEFLIAVCGIDRSEAPMIAERLRLSVGSSTFDIGRGKKISKTVSIGFASFPVDIHSPLANDWEQAVELADARLYCAKRAGRNQWVGDASARLSLKPLEKDLTNQL